MIVYSIKWNIFYDSMNLVSCRGLCVGSTCLLGSFRVFRNSCKFIDFVSKSLFLHVCIYLTMGM